MGVPYAYDDDEGQGRAVFIAFLIICSFLFSISNLYTICLVGKFGFCFVEGMEAEINNGLQNNDAQALRVNEFLYVL